MVKLAEIAKESGFSIPVVSRVLSPKPHKDARVADETRKHIREIAGRLGYRPNRAAEFLKRGKNPVIGCFLPARADALLARLMKGIGEEAEKKNFPLAFYFNVDKNSYLEFITRSRQSRNCGIITYPYFKMDPEIEALITAYQNDGGKMILIEGGSRNWQWRGCTSVSIDNYHGGRLAAEYLLAKKVSHLWTRAYDYIPERITGFSDTVAAAGKQIEVLDTSAVVGSGDILNSISIAAAGFLATRIHDFLQYSTEGPVGVYLPNDQEASYLMHRLLELNVKVGKEVLIVGYNGLYLTESIQPLLTTIKQPFEKVGAYAVEKLVAMIYGVPAKSILVKPELIPGKSA
ncbi:MAG: LacI family DNA-binding transcriptional regulator [Victivallaceae bacterium]